VRIPRRPSNEAVDFESLVGVVNARDFPAEELTVHDEALCSER
jgi:hypothetical protein